MKIERRSTFRAALMIALMLIITIASSRLRADTGTCGGASITLPFTDVSSSNIFFCSIAEAFFSGLTNGTSPTTYSPADPVPREQMAAFVTRTLDQSLNRGSRRAALDEWWIPQNSANLAFTDLGTDPRLLKSDGADIWIAGFSGTVSRVRASDGKLLENWTGATSAYSILVAMGHVYITGHTIPGRLYEIDPTQPAGLVSIVTNALGDCPLGIAFDGTRIWTVNECSPGSISIITLNPTSVTNVQTGFSNPQGIIFDGTNIWVADGDANLKRLESDGNISQTIPVGMGVPQNPGFDGINIWVPNLGTNTVTIVRVKDAHGDSLTTPFVLATLSGNGLNLPRAVAFDGERVLITNVLGNSVSLWKATDLSPLGSFSTGENTEPTGACSDGLNFWITLQVAQKLARF
jgi:hypothetical protein